MRSSYPLLGAVALTVALVGCASPGADLHNTQFEIREGDNGRTFTYLETSRMVFVLDENRYPQKQFSCTPAGVIGRITDAPVFPAPLYSLQFEAVKAGGTAECVDGDFHVTVKVVAND